MANAAAALSLAAASALSRAAAANCSVNANLSAVMEMAATVSTSKRKSSSAPVPPRDSSAVTKAASSCAETDILSRADTWFLRLGIPTEQYGICTGLESRGGLRKNLRGLSFSIVHTLACLPSFEATPVRTAPPWAWPRMALTEYAKQLGAFMTLVVVQAMAILLFKLCQNDGKYTFNPASSVALTEMCKLLLAGSLHYNHVASSKKPLWEGVSPKIVFHYLGLSMMYTINNQLSFYCLELADPGSMALGKSIAPYLCALLLRLAGERLHALKWVCIIVQCCAIAIVQYDACKGTGYLPMKAYYMIGTATSITAITSVWNQLIIKGFEVPANLQNSFLYAFGSAFAIISYLHSVSDTHGHGHGHGHAVARPKGFFEGYTLLASLLVLFQAFHGLAVALVYTYADAIVKNFANSSVMAILIIISYLYFGLETTLHSWLGIIIVLTITYCYMNLALRKDLCQLLDWKPPSEPPAQEKAHLLEEGEKTDGEGGDK